MRRTVVCLLIALASATVAARESKLSDAGGGGCPSHDDRPVASRTVDHDAVPTVAPAGKAKTASHGGGGEDLGGRLQSPRWHRFLPGMFR